MAALILEFERDLAVLADGYGWCDEKSIRQVLRTEFASVRLRTFAFALELHFALGGTPDYPAAACVLDMRLGELFALAKTVAGVHP